MTLSFLELSGSTQEEWPRPADGHGVAMVTAPLDLDDLLAELKR